VQYLVCSASHWICILCSTFLEFRIFIEKNPKVLTYTYGFGHHPHKLHILQQHHNIVINIKLDFECYSRLRLLAHYNQNLIFYLIFEGRHTKQVGLDILNYLLFISIISHTDFVCYLKLGSLSSHYK